MIPNVRHTALSQRLRDNPDENVNDVLQDMYRNMNELDAFGSEEKSTPLQILGDLADYSGTIFIPHYEAAFGMANKMMEHDSETVRRTAILTSFRMSFYISFFFFVFSWQTFS
jgi:hypothetical protein